MQAITRDTCSSKGLSVLIYNSVYKMSINAYQMIREYFHGLFSIERVKHTELKSKVQELWKNINSGRLTIYGYYKQHVYNESLRLYLLVLRI